MCYNENGDKMEFLLKEAIDCKFSLEACQIIVSKVEKGKPLQVDLHWHDVFEIVKCEGEGSLFIEGKRYEYSYGDIVCVPCRFLHGYRGKDDRQYFVYFIYPEYLLSRHDCLANSLLEFVLEGKYYLPFIIKQENISYVRILKCLNELYDAVNEKAYLQIHSLLYLLFSELPFDSNKVVQLNSNRHIIQEIISFIEKNFANHITLDDLSREAEMSKSKFMVVFKQCCGVTPIQYLLNFRLKQAYKKLSQGYSVTETAFDTGFNNLSYFTRMFKEKYSYYPKDIKKTR